HPPFVEPEGPIACEDRQVLNQRLGNEQSDRTGRGAWAVAQQLIVSGIRLPHRGPKNDKHPGSLPGAVTFQSTYLVGAQHAAPLHESYCPTVHLSVCPTVQSASTSSGNGLGTAPGTVSGGGGGGWNPSGGSISISWYR